MRYAFSLLLLLATAQAANAHAFLVHSNIGAGAKLKAAPKTLTLDFSEALEPAFSSVTVTDAQGHGAADGVSSASGTRMSLTFRALKPGAYKVVWHAVSIDTHRTEGDFVFTVAP